MAKASTLELDYDDGNGSAAAFSLPDVDSLKPYEVSEAKSSATFHEEKSDDVSIAAYRDFQKIKTPSWQRVQPKPMPVFTTATMWESEVVDVDLDNHTFTALIKEEDSEDSSTDDYVDFSFSEVKKDEWKYIKQGALFNWHVGHEQTAKGQCKNTSLIIFRMMPVWKNKAEQADKKAQFFSNLIKKFSK